jgi:hypothetical protein
LGARWNKFHVGIIILGKRVILVNIWFIRFTIRLDDKFFVRLKVYICFDSIVGKSVDEFK